ncbi:hypothetical protein B0T19DRAFT_479326 [Cercophora scortea]|uniref:DUF7730 domain-containing protein n=1 Tax=Cercophora scortea TaxID=314031 RepID=A0AAE0I414_9PEZI|nr:hypothetical protein B0T19DRAFT_479326 [Cercophora scortea]
MSPLKNIEVVKGSPFFSFPLEIRRAIYSSLEFPNAIHVFLRNGKVALSICVEPETGGYGDNGAERRPEGCDQEESTTELVWARRLQSTWGAHWRCDEIAQGISSDGSGDSPDRTIMAVLSVCKRMRAEISELLARHTVFNVTDLETLDVLAQAPRGSEILSSPCSLLSFAIPSLRKLSITLRLRLPLLRALENDTTETTFDGDAPAADANLMAECSRVRATWSRTWPLLALQLKQLRHLYIWLDHEDKRSWSLVDECKILLPVAASMSPARIASLKDVTFNLPKLHPRYEDPERHFTKGSAQTPELITIHRRLRQRYFAEQDASGRLSVEFKPDFPVMYEVNHLALQGQLSMPDEEYEEYERGQWESGVDVELELEFEFESIRNWNTFEHTA